MQKTIVSQIVLGLAIAIFLNPANATEPSIMAQLSDALVCKGDPEGVVNKLVDKGSNFDSGYAASGFGDGTSYKAIVILRSPLKIGEAKTSAVIAETDNSNSDFAAFTYAVFEGNFQAVVRLLKLQAAQPFNEQSLGRYVSQPAPKTGCPHTIALTPVDKTHFLLGCGWCNGS